MAQQLYAVNTLGGYWSVPDLSTKLRSKAQPMYRLRSFIDAFETMGQGNGDSWLFDKTGDVETQGGTLVETETIPETNFITNQGTGTITEYGNSIGYTFKLNQLGQFSVSQQVEQKLRDDMVKVIESAAGDQFAATDYIAVLGTGSSVTFTTNGTATATASANGNAGNNREIVDYLRRNLVPKYDGTNYVCVASINYLSGFHSDTGAGGWVDISKYTDMNVSSVFAGEVGTYYMTRFVEENGYLSNVIGAGSNKGQAVYLGSDTVYEAVSVPEEIRVKTSVDYGRDLGLAWYALLGFKLVWDYAVDGEQHVLFVTSA